MKFRPQAIPKWFRIKNRKWNGYDWVAFIGNLDYKMRTFLRLHYLGSHSPLSNKWYKIERKFENRYKRTEF